MYTVHLSQRICTELFSRTLLDLAHDNSSAFSTKVRVIVICAMFTTLLTNTRQCPLPQSQTPLPLFTTTDAQALHVTRPVSTSTAQWVHEQGRLATNSPRTGYEPNLAGNVTSCESTHEDEFPTTKSQITHLQHRRFILTLSTKTIFEPHRLVPASHRLQHAQEERDVRASVCHSKREDTPRYLSKHVETWLAQGKDHSSVKGLKSAR